MSLPANLPQSMERANTEFSFWCLRPKPGHALEHVTDPDYWVHILQSRSTLKADDVVRVIPQDRSYCVDLMFVEVDERRLWAKTRVLHLYWDTAEAPEQRAVGRYKTEWGGAHKWRVVTLEGAVVEKGFGTEGEAREYMLQAEEQRAA